MTTRVIILATDSGDREDGSVDYSDYLLVSSDTLAFDEPIFNQYSLKTKEFFAEPEDPEGAAEWAAYDESKDRNGWRAPRSSRSKFVKHLEALGYTVEDASVKIYWAKGYSE